MKKISIKLIIDLLQNNLFYCNLKFWLQTSQDSSAYFSQYAFLALRSFRSKFLHFVTKSYLAKGLILVAVFSIWSSSGQATMIGDQRSFYVDSSYDEHGRTALTATLQEISQRAYFYVEDEWWNGLGSLNEAKLIIHNLAIEFDEKIYPKLTKVYGSPWEPGIDGDAQITILISRLKESAGGYFNSADEYPRAQAPLSNEREMIYLNALYYNSPRLKSFLAHEFQHLINFYQKEKLWNITEEIWLNEARSEYASTLIGYDEILAGSNLEKRISDFLKNPSDSLTEWSNDTPDYGSVNLFMQYLISHYGEQILTKMTQSPYIGIVSINQALSSLGFKETFSEIFINWIITNYLGDCKIEGQKYCYLNTILNEKVKVLPTVNQTLPSVTNFSVGGADFIKDWSGHWYKFSGGLTNLKIDFEGGSNTSFVVAYAVEKINGASEVKFIKLNLAQQGIGFVQNFGSEVKSVILIPVSATKLLGFGALEPFRGFSYEVNLTPQFINPEAPETLTPSFVAPNFPDGSLIRAKGDFKVYIVKNGFKRWIQSAEIFNFYPHLGWQSVIEVTPEQRDWYRDTWLVRADGDTKVFEINGDGTKHWLNMTAEQFSVSGRKWEMVYIINNAERDWYKIGADVLFK